MGEVMKCIVRIMALGFVVWGAWNAPTEYVWFVVLILGMMLFLKRFKDE
jgi:hypothetical protein